jgi:hypothetical protein
MAVALAPLVGALATLWLVIPTVAPAVGDWDTAEFQTVTWVLGTGHPTGFPPFVIVGFIATHLMPFGEVAYRLNLFQALLAAGAIACLVAIVQYLTEMRLVALASGLLLLTLPAWTRIDVRFPNGQEFKSTPVFWRIATSADYHMLHLFLVALLFLLLLVWQRSRGDPERRRRANRLLVVASVVYGFAFANHGLAYLMAPAIGLFVVVVAPRTILNWRLVLACAVALATTIVVLFAELPIRAAMHTPLVYGHPDTWSGFLYVVQGQQFSGSLKDPLGDLGAKYTQVMQLFAAWLGPFVFLACIGIATSLVRRPAYVLLGLLTSVPMAVFSSSYYNQDVERYFLVPLFVAVTFVGLGLADAISLLVWSGESAFSFLVGRRTRSAGKTAVGPANEAGEIAVRSDVDPAREDRPTREKPGFQGVVNTSWWPALLALELVAAAILVVGCLGVTPVRAAPLGSHGGAGVSRADKYGSDRWMRAVLAPVDEGGLPQDAVILTWWNVSTTLWYGQKVDGLRPDIFVVDDRTRLDQNMGSVYRVIDMYLGHRPIFLDRLGGAPLAQHGDGMVALEEAYVVDSYRLPSGYSITQVIAKNTL